MKAREVMTTENLLTIREDDTLAAAAHRMTWGRCRHLPVLRDHQVVAVISERDLLAWLGQGRSLDGPTDLVRSAMIAPAVVADPDEEIGELAARLLSRRIGCLPIVLDDRLVGMVTSSDLLGRIVAEMFGPVLDRG